MKNLKLLADKFNTLTKRGKMLTLFAGIIIVLILLDACR